ncbi:MAG: chemotaxis protein CheA [Spirochaetaceae bacterium]|nr:chemotaxis protein CheA [Spirochaetaceae bacterium]
MNDIYNEKMQAAFFEEAEEILVELETTLMELEKNPQNMEVINQVFRALHTLKGSGSMFGFDKIAVFAHEIESVFDFVRNNKLPVTSSLIDITLAARDSISRMLAGDEDSDELIKQNEEIIKKFKVLAGKVKSPEVLLSESAPKKAVEKETPSENVQSLSIFRIRFKPGAEIFVHGTNPLNLLDELKEMGDCHITAHPQDIPKFENLNPEYCYVSWDIILSTGEGINAIKDIFIFVEDESEIKIEIIEDEIELIDEGASKKLGEILIERGVIDEGTLKNFLIRQEPIGKMLTKAGLADKTEIDSALAEQSQIKKVKESREKLQKKSSIRVGSDKLDSLINIVGELVTIQAGFSQKALENNNIEFQSLAEEVERITSTLRDLSMSLRMVPIGTTFSRFKRLIRDLSQQLGKKIELVTEGGETQLDATIIEHLSEPLVHLIRNSIDHGIEKPGKREKAGKSPTGTIYLSAIHSGAYVLIQVRDDGAGLDSGELLDKAVKNGIIPSGSIPTEKEIFKLIFAPGFSTVKEVTGVSGRGVGMDVVKRTIEELGGTIEIVSKRGNGTLITLKIPLTLAIIRGLLVRIGNEHYIIPLASVEECIEIQMTDADRGRDTSQFNVRGDLIPYLNLRKIFSINGQTSDIDHIVIIISENRKTGLLVDEVIGEQQTVVKNLGIVYKDVEGISGATILGDGTVALILDTLKLIKSSELIGEAVVK